MFCPNCGNPNKDGSKFCCKCGFELASRSVTNKQQPPVRNSNKKNGKKIVAIILAAVVVLSTAVVGFTVDFKKVLMSDFEYYLYLENKNIENFAGKDLINLIKNYDSFSAESTVTGSLSGGAVGYDDDLAVWDEILKLSSLAIESNYDGEIYNLDVEWKEKSGPSVMDAMLTVLNGDIILSSETLTDKAYSLSKNAPKAAETGDIKEVFLDLLLSTYEYFDKFKDYTTIESTRHNGDNASIFVLDLDYRATKDLIKYVADYLINNDTFVSLLEKCIVAYCGALGWDFYDEFDGSFKEYLKEEFYDEIDDLDIIEDRIGFEYEVIYNKKGQILNREFIIKSYEYDDEISIECITDIDSDGTLISEFNVGDREFLKLDNYDEKITADLNFGSNIEWVISLSNDDNSIDLSFNGCDNKYYCGYDYDYYGNTKYIYDELVLQFDLKTEFSDYRFEPDESVIKKAGILEGEDEIEIIAEKIPKLVYEAFIDDFDY